MSGRSDSSTESEDEGIDVISLITGGQEGELAAHWISEQDLRDASKPIDHIAREYNNNDHSSHNDHIHAETQTEKGFGQDDEFQPAIPLIFQTEGARNAELHKNDRKIKKDLHEEETKVNHEYNQLLGARTKIIDELNDNGTNGKVHYLLTNNQRLIDQLTKLELKGLPIKRNYYFFIHKLKTQAPKNTSTQKTTTLQVILHPQHQGFLLQQLQDSKDPKIAQEKSYCLDNFLADCYNVDDVPTLKAAVAFLQLVSEKHLNASFTESAFYAQIASLGGCLSHATNRNLPEKLVFFNDECEAIVYKSILSLFCVYFGQSGTLQASQGVLEACVLLMCDHNVARNHRSLLERTMVPLLVRMYGQEECSRGVVEVLGRFEFSHEQVFCIVCLFSSGGAPLLQDLYCWYGCLNFESAQQKDVRVGGFFFAELPRALMDENTAATVLENLYYRLRFLVLQKDKVEGPINECLEDIGCFSIKLQEVKDRAHRKLGEILKCRAGSEDAIRNRVQIYQLLENLCLRTERLVIFHQRQQDYFYVSQLEQLV